MLRHATESGSSLPDRVMIRPSGSCGIRLFLRCFAGVGLDLLQAPFHDLDAISVPGSIATGRPSPEAGRGSRSNVKNRLRLRRNPARGIASAGRSRTSPPASCRVGKKFQMTEGTTHPERPGKTAWFGRADRIDCGWVIPAILSRFGIKPQGGTLRYEGGWLTGHR